MANMLYNGVELPDINTVWTDKTAYPYAIITSFDAALVGYSGSSTIYLLDASGVAHYNNNGVCYKNPPYLSGSWFCSYDPDVCAYLSGIGLPITVGEWGGSSPSDIGSGSAQSVVGTVFWSNVDILNTDNSVYLAASTPIRVDSKLKISVGGGYYSYNGVLLPALPKWDKATYPYATIFRTASDPTFMLILTSQPQIISDNHLTCASDFAIDIYYSFATTNYSEFDHYETFPRQVSALWNIATTALLDQSWAWANHDVLLSDNSVLVPASEPVPVSPKVYYEGTEPCAYSSAFGAFVSAELLNEPGPSVGDTVYVMWDGVLYEDVVTTAAAFGNAPMFGDLTLSTRPYVIGYMDIDGNGEAGWFFATGTSGEHTLRVYAVEEGGEVTATTADVTFTCSNLENTEPIDSIHAWVYKKSDGLNTTISPTWTSEMFAAPSYSTSHTFTGLTPNTEYEVYGCIFVNGEATDHNAIAAFTTLEGESITFDKTAFLSGMAMGLTGKGYPAEANGHMSYNGIELADISSIWTDKSNHVFICKADNSYFAIVSTVAPYQDSVNGGVSLSAPFYFKQYGCFTDEATANEYGTTAYTWKYFRDHSMDEGGSNFDQTVIWTSTDIRKDSDGSMFLAASEPIPTGGIGGNDDFTKGYLVGAELRRKRNNTV